MRVARSCFGGSGAVDSRHTEGVIVRIRAACASDLPALRDVFRRSSLSNEGDRDLLLARPEVLELADEGITEGRTQVAVGADDEILGFITTRPLDACALEIRGPVRRP